LVSGVFQQAILDWQLQSIYEALNPAELYRRLTELRVQLEEARAGKSEGFGKRAYRDTDIRHQQAAQSRGGSMKSSTERAGLSRVPGRPVWLGRSICCNNS
jgi:hypothetical protein